MITVKQFADKLGKSRQWVHQLMAAGRIKPAPQRVGCYYLVDPKAKVLDKRKA